ncbi:MAG: hypothetical protein ACXVHQ_39035 [Solirubrobacteraceae bacterium]
MTADSLTSVRELDCRWTNDIQVRLLWRQVDGRVSVVVTDTRSQESFRLDVPDGERPLDFFYHPFAYAAHQRVDRDFRETLEVARERRRHESDSGARP